jgi:glutamate:GABA antiporter
MQLRRSLRLIDVVLFFLIACTNLQWIATAAAAGAGSLTVWLIGCAAMFVPISIAVMALSAQYPDEGGMYVWSKRAFGPFAGFITGWTYWCSNLPYFPALLYFMAGNALFIGGGNALGLSASPLYYIGVSLLGFAIATIVNVLGLDVGKWLNNVGAFSRWIVTLLLIGLGALAFAKFGSATPINAATLHPSLQFKDLIFWSVIVFAWTGPEAVPFVAGEVQNPRRTIPLGLMLAAPAIATVYILGTAGVLVALPHGNISGLYGVMQAIDGVAKRVGWFGVTPIAGILVTISCLGSVGAWLGAVARIPFVAGIDRYLPDAFGRMHPRWGSPVAALLAQAGISTVFILLGQGGTTVKGAYNVLVSSTVLITLIPFLFLFASAIKLRAKPLVIVAATIGFITTTCAIVLAAFPADDEPNKPLAVVKVLGLTVLMLGGGALVYFKPWAHSDRAELRPSPDLPQPAKPEP